MCLGYRLNGVYAFMVARAVGSRDRFFIPTYANKWKLVFGEATQSMTILWACLEQVTLTCYDPTKNFIYHLISMISYSARIFPSSIRTVRAPQKAAASEL